MSQHQTDILIIGLGLAGMTAAITAAKSGKKITILTKTKAPTSGNTPWAQGGIVYMGTKDAPEKLKKGYFKSRSWTLLGRGRRPTLSIWTKTCKKNLN